MSYKHLRDPIIMDSTLQRLRDVAGGLILPERQKEELVNYVNGFMKNFRFNVCQDQENSWNSNALAINPIIRSINPFQGSYALELQPTGDVRDLRIPALFRNDKVSVYRFVFLYTSSFFIRLNDGNDIVKEIQVPIFGEIEQEWADLIWCFGKITDTSPIVTMGNLVAPDLSDIMFDAQQVELFFTCTGLLIEFSRKR